MIRIACTVVLNLLVFGAALAASSGEEFAVEVTSYSDGVFLLSNRDDLDLEVNFARPDGTVTRSKHLSTDAVFLEVNSLFEGEVVDGLYRYEIVPVPIVTMTRDPGSDEVDPATVKQPAISGRRIISGSFRVTNGTISDPAEPELPIVEVRK